MKRFLRWFLSFPVALLLASCLVPVTALLASSPALADCSGVPTANKVCASPNGSAGPVNPRALVGADLPTKISVIEALTAAANKLPYYTGAAAAALADFTAFARTLLDDADAPTARATLGVVIGSDVQAFDADLAALAANATDGLWAHSGAGTGAARTLTAPAAGLGITNPAGIAGNPTFALANDLAALEGLASTGFAARTGSDAWAQRSIAGTASQIAVADGDGVAANPTLSLDADIACLGALATAADKLAWYTGAGTCALADLSAYGRTLAALADAAAGRTALGLVIGTNVEAFDADLDALAANATAGLWTRTGAGTGAARTLAGTANEITATNGDGVAGNPTLSLPAALTFTGKTVTGGTFAAPTVTGLADVQGVVKLSGDATPAEITANQNDYNPGSAVCTTASVLRISTDASRDITGLAGGADGCILVLANVGSFAAVLKDESTSSAAANRFGFGADLTLASKQGAVLIYDATALRWHQIGGPSASGGGSGTVTSVTCGTGLTGGTITTSGTCAADLGKQTLYVPAGAMVSETTTGCADGLTETATNLVMVRTKDCDGATQEGVQFMVGMPKSWDEGTLTFRVDWTAASGSGDVIWLLSCLARSNDDALDTAFGTEISVTDTLLAALDVHQSPETSAVTPGGTPAEADNLWCRLQRDADAAGDTLDAVDARVLGLRALYTVNASKDD